MPAPYCIHCGSENVTHQPMLSEADICYECGDCGSHSWYEPGFSGGHDLSDELDTKPFVPFIHRCPGCGSYGTTYDEVTDVANCPECGSDF